MTNISNACSFLHYLQYNKVKYCFFFRYFLGLLTATVSSEVFKAAQPALLYLVPFTLLPLLTLAYLKVIILKFRYFSKTNLKKTIQQGDLRRMWSEPFITHQPTKQLEV